MHLIKENISKKRSTYLLDNGCYRKYLDRTDEWFVSHKKILDEVMPGYVNQIGGGFIDLNPIEGRPCNILHPTQENIKRIYEYCIQQIYSTLPYVHGDWAPSNIIETPKGFVMVDWDNVGIYSLAEAYDKLNSDMTEAYGDLFKLLEK
jgi:thiamine kinase-like enzyme